MLIWFHAFLIQYVSGEACEIEIILKNIKFSFKDLTMLLENLSFDQRNLC